MQLAIQGKLTANWREENAGIEPAADLLNRIQKEKAQLVNDKKIRKEKSLSEIDKDEIPYELPNSWVWVKLGEVGSLINGDRGKNYPSKEHYISEGIPFITARNLGERFLKHEALNYISEEKYNLLRSGQVQLNDILYCLRGSLGKCSIVEGIEKGAIASSLVIVRVTESVDSVFLLNYFSSRLGKEMIYKHDNGTAQPNLSASNVKEFYLPLPPLEEQKEIVKVVETLFEEVEQLEQLTLARIGLKEGFAISALKQLTTNNANQEWAFLQEHFKSFFNETTNIKKLRETVLQLAVQGKLTADWRAKNPDTEDATILLKRIQEEKAQLIKDKKIKKEKALPKITKDEISYDLPEGWVWCRLGDISSIRVGATPKREIPEYWNGNIPWISSGEVANNFILNTKEKITEKGLSESSVTIYPVGTVLVAMIGQGKTRGQTSILKIKAGTNQNVGGIIIFHNYLISEYLWHYFLSRYEKTRSNAVGGNQPAINGTKLKMSAFGLPPIEEQKAIVEKVNTLMGLCDTLEQEVQQSQEYSEILMQSVLREVFTN
ncbi:restriction endonuclease subunit S [Lacinutrix sp. MEBiC02595]